MPLIRSCGVGFGDRFGLFFFGGVDFGLWLPWVDWVELLWDRVLAASCDVVLIL